RIICLATALVYLTLPISTVAQSPPPSSRDDFPAELVRWNPLAANPIFTAEGPGHWDVKIRERGWILRTGDTYRLWFTGYDGTRESVKHLGYATSADGVHWTRWATNPIYRDHWVEDVCVVPRGNKYYMFAEGAADNHAEMLTSTNGVDWTWAGEL